MPEQFSFSADQYLLIGKVTRAHGLKGELKVVSFSGQPENYLTYRRLALVATDGRMTNLLDIEKARPQAKQVIIKLETIDTKTEADQVAGMGVLLLRDDLPVLAGDEYYLHQFEGLEVRTVDSEKVLGIVENFFSNGAQDILVVRDGADEFLVPIVKDVIVRYDEKQIVIDPPPGLLDINTSEDPYVE